jgi:hypothetical protein
LIAVPDWLYNPSFLGVIMRTYRWMAGFVLLMSFGLMSVGAQPAAASELSARWEIQAGPSYMNNSSTTALFVERVGAARPLSGSFAWAPDVSLGYLAGRSTPSRYGLMRPGLSDDVVLGALGVRIQMTHTPSVWSHFFFSFQAAAHTGRTQALSSVYEFVSTAGWTSRRISVQVRHISNGSLHEPNRGETMLLVGLAF